MNLSVEDVAYTYPSGVTALRGVSLSLAAGECAALVGQNGAGKTTLAKHFNGLLRPTHGRVRVGEWDTRTRSVAQLAASVGFAFQNPDDQLFQPTVRREVGVGPRYLGWPPDRAARSVEAALDLMGLAEVAERHPYDLSLADRKRVAVAAVLAMETPIVVLDEPTAGQDAEGTHLMGTVVERLKAQGRTVVAVTHDPDFCAEHFERVVVIGEGRVLLDGPARQVLAQADVLTQTNVDPPQILRLAQRLGMTETPLTVEEFVEVWGRSVKRDA